jgi:hypothetical protein
MTEWKTIVWNVTVVSTLAESYLSSCKSPAAAAELAAERKQSKYANLSESYMFQPIPLRPINSSPTKFPGEPGRRLKVMLKM